MPKLTIEVDECDWQLLREWAAQRRCNPEELARDILEQWLRRTNKRLKDEAWARLPRGSLARVMGTLDTILQVFPSATPPPSREEVDAYLQAERDLWDKRAEE